MRRSVRVRESLQGSPRNASEDTLKREICFTIKIRVFFASELLNGLDFAFPDKPQYIHDVFLWHIFSFALHKR